MSKQFQLDLTPDSHLISSVVNTKIRTAEAFSELVDNSFDAGASKIHITTGANQITVEDNGRGCPDLNSMLTFGRHRRQSTTRLGRYGVGLKNATCGMGDGLMISSVFKHVRKSVELCWSDIESNGWKSVSGDEEDAPGEPSGTIVEVTALRRGIHDKCVMDNLRFNFAPALWSGKEIELNDRKIVAWELPLLSDEVTAEEQHDTLPISFSLRAGMTEMNGREPFIIAYEHRIIGGTSEPCGSYNTSSRFIALVQLAGDWTLAKHKDGLSDRAETEWLYERLHAVCEGLLKKVHQLGESVELNEIAAELGDAISAAIGKAKRPNKPGGKNVGEPPEPKPRPVNYAVVVDPEDDGEVEQRKAPVRRRGFGIIYCSLPDGAIGRVQVNGRHVCVELNDLHPFVIESRRAKNLVCLKTIAVFLLCGHQMQATDKSQMVLPLDDQGHPNPLIAMASTVFKAIATSEETKQAAA